MELLPAAQEHVLAQENGKERFVTVVRELGQAFALAVPHEATTAIRDDVAFFQTVRSALSKRSAALTASASDPRGPRRPRQGRIMTVMAAALPPPQAAWPLPSPTRGDERGAPGVGQRLALVSLLALLAAAGAAMTANFAWPWSVYEDRIIYAGRIEQFPPGTVMPFPAVRGASGHPALHLVRLDDGEFLALLDRSPHLGNPVLYLPDLVLYGGTGWFREPLHHETFDMAGYRVFGPAPRGLDRLAVEVRDGGVFVDPRTITRGTDWAPEGHEDQTGGALLLPPFTLPSAH